MADPPHWLKESSEKLAKLQRRLSRMEPGSKNYQQAVQKYRELHFYPSSRTCHRYGHQLTEAVSYRRKTWTCPNCGTVLNREVNAARNIKAQGLSQLERYRAVS